MRLRDLSACLSEIHWQFKSYKTHELSSRKNSGTSAVCILTSCGCSPALAKDAPASPDELAKQLEQALQTKNQRAALALVCWDGVSPDMKTQQEAPFHTVFDEIGQGQQLSSVKAGPLTPDTPLESVLNGVKYRPNLKILGTIHVTLDEDTNPTEFVFCYGKKDNGYWLVALVEAKPSENTDDKK